MDASSGYNSGRETEYRLAQLEEEFQQQTLAMATSLVSLIDLRDRYTGGHSQRVAKYVRSIAVQMCLPDDETERTVFAASLHDIGKIGVPDHILLKPGRLDEEEFGWIRKHPEWGWMASRNVNGFQQAALLVLHHHERLDGDGYPSRLRGTEIPLGSRLIAVADSYDALTTNRPYRSARSQAEAVAELQRNAGTQLDPQVVNAFCRAISGSKEMKQSA
ncbi:MAG TPA: HD-GYP domain-containing protein [Terriglobia bacterium]|jgi:HD-GYP domain-containing protein (c-di-GMP phosphodiesterase class II)